MNEEKKQSVSVLRPLGCFGVIAMIYLFLVLGGVPLAFMDLPGAILVLGVTFFLLLMVYGKDLFYFIPHSIVALFSKNVKPNPLFAQIALSGSRYAIAAGALGTLMGVINMLQNLEDSSYIAVGFSVCLLSLFYSLILAELFFISVYNIYSSKSIEAEASGSVKITRIHYILPILLILSILMIFFLLIVELPHGNGRRLCMTEEVNNYKLHYSGNEISLPNFRAELKNEDSFFMFRVVLVMNNPKDAAFLFDRINSRADNMLNARGEIESVLASQKRGELATIDGKMKFALKVKDALNKFMSKEKYPGRIIKVEFRNEFGL